MPRNRISGINTTNNDVDDRGPGGINNQLPSLKQTAEQVRSQITSFNIYKDVPTQQYSPQHPDALSDGDSYGRGENSNTVGNIDDIHKKNELLYNSGNKYKPGQGYNNINPGEQYW